MEKEFKFDLNCLSDEELLQSFINTASINSTALTTITALLMCRIFTTSQALQQENEKLKQEILRLRQKTPISVHTSKGRKQKEFFLGKILLTDEELIYQIDREYYTLSQLEKEVGAGKNQLRNRYKRAKKKKASDRPWRL